MESISQANAGMARRRLRRPLLCGLRRVAWVLTGLVAIIAFLGLDAGGGDDFGVIASALAQLAVVWALYAGIRHFSIHPPQRVRAWMTAFLKTRRRDRSEMTRVVHLVSWIAGVAAVVLVLLMADPQSSGNERAMALLSAVALAVGTVRLIGWIVRGFVRAG